MNNDPAPAPPAAAAAAAAGGAAPPYWDEDQLSWEDSERFEEDSLCSWMSEPESLVQNWRGWSTRNSASSLPPALSYTGGIAYSAPELSGGGGRASLPSLYDLSARCIARSLSPEDVEVSAVQLKTQMDSRMWQRIAYWCFPSGEDDIRLYSCLANGNADEFQRGETLYRTSKCVRELLQIGFHLSAVVVVPPMVLRGGASSAAHTFNVAVTVDRCRITSCTCTCNPAASWCCHVVAVCLHRVHHPDAVRLRAPIAESFNQLKQVEQLRKFSQYFIYDLPRQFLPIAQRLLDELLSPDSQKNTTEGAPDPTAGASRDDVPNWCLDEQSLHDNLRKILIKFCVPSPTVFSDVNYLTSSQPPAASDWQTLLRPLRGREPEGLWNLLSIVREMYRRHDENSVGLLHIITEECLSHDQVIIWWYLTHLYQSGKWALMGTSNNKSGFASSQHNAQYSCASLCDELVALWRLAALNPRQTDGERAALRDKLRFYHRKTVERVWKLLSNTSSETASSSGVFGKLAADSICFDLDCFSGFEGALVACLIPRADDSAEPLGGAYDGAQLSVNCAWAAGGAAPARTTVSCLMPSPNLPIIREKQYRRVLQASSSCETLTAACCSPAGALVGGAFEHEAVSSESGQESEGVDSPSTGVANLSLDAASLADDAAPAQPLDAVDEQLDEMERIYKARPVDQQAAEASRSRSGVAPSRVCPLADINNLLDSISAPADLMEARFAHCEALFAFGQTKEAIALAVSLAHELLESPPDLMVEYPSPSPVAPQAAAPQLLTPMKANGGKRKKKSTAAEAPVFAHPLAIKQSRLAVETFRKTIFLFQVLAKDSSCNSLAFRVALFGLELPRQPAATKFLEVRLLHQQSEIAGMLKQIKIQSDQLEMLRERARKFLSGHYVEVAAPVLPFALAHYVFEVLCTDRATLGRSATDEQLGFDAAIASLGLKAVKSEAEHPLLCEGARRQRGELAVALLLRYKDNQDKVALVMDRLLDRDIHQMYRHGHTNAAYFSHARHALPTAPPPDAVAVAFERSLSGVSRCSSGGGPDDVEPLSVAARSHNCAPTDSGCDTSLTGRILLRRSTDEGNESGTSPPFSAATVGEDILLPLPSASRNHSHASSAASNSAASTSRAKWTPSDGLPAGAYYSKYSSRNRKRATPRDPNQPSEAHAHYMNELAKRLLTEAGGSHSTAIFNAPQNGAVANAQPPSGYHRTLHLCAFHIGLYALGVNNGVMHNWLSRTYSQHVSWISSQAMEIGRAAVRILIDTWENHLTPVEVANLADRASQGREPSMVQAAAELALSVLPHAHALNPTDIQRALEQCREQSTVMLERACIAIEQAAKDCGVNPTVLFMVARRWSDLFGADVGAVSAASAGGEAAAAQQRRAHAASSSVQQPTHQIVSPLLAAIFAPPPLPPSSVAQMVNQPQQQQNLMSLPCWINGPFVQLPNSAHVVPWQAHPSAVMQQNLGSVTAAQLQHFRNANMAYGQMATTQNFMNRPLHSSQSAPSLAQQHQPQRHRHQPHHHHLQQHGNFATLPAMPPLNLAVQPPPQQQQQVFQQISIPAGPPPEPLRPPADPNIRYLYSAYRVGMLAMETMGKFSDDQRAYIKYSKNPSYGDDVKWLFSVSQKLGLPHVYQFCISAADNVVSPYVLWELATEAARFFPVASPHIPQQQLVASVGGGLAAPHALASSLQSSGGGGGAAARLADVSSRINASGLATPATLLLLRCLTMFYTAANQKLSHPRFMPSDSEEVCSLVRAAKVAFFQLPAPTGSHLYRDFIENLRGQKACKKKDVRDKVLAAAQN